MVEVEKRTFIQEEQYKKIIEKYCKGNVAEKQITTYFDCEQDFRLMETNNYLQLWIKGGKLHDNFREESVVKIDKKYTQDLRKMLDMLGYNTQIIWYRTRYEQKYKDMQICIDYTEGYGYILEVEKCVEELKDVDDATKEIVEFFDENGIELCSKNIFTEKYEYYKEHWRELTKNVDK